MSNDIGLDRKRERNLRQLATYLWHLPKSRFGKTHQFSMSQFDNNIFKSEANSTDCGTAGCAVGHAPYAGIHKKLGETWTEFSERQLFCATSPSEYARYQFLFGYSWRAKDNTPRGAARRIFCLLNGQAVPGSAMEVYRHYRPKPSDFVKLPKPVLKRLGRKKQPVCP